MKYFNIKLIAVLSAVFMMASCEEEITREPSPEANPSSNKVYFPAQESKLTLPIDASSFEVTIAREVSSSALTVNLHYSGGYADLFKVPQTIAFAAGEAEKTFEISLGNIELMKTYNFQVEIADVDQTNPYKLDTVNFYYPIIGFSLMKEDFAPYSKGEYYSGWWEEAWEAEMEYSPATEQYRIKEFCGYEGYDAIFKWDGGSSITMIGSSKVGTRTGFQTGYVHPSYGMVYASFSAPEGPFEYDAATKTFTFGYAWRVSAGSFGVAEDYYTIETVY
jgi:hypothetical protein